MARRALERDEAKRARAGLDVPFNRVQLRIYDDELALGITCAGGTARAARENEHLLAASAR